ncbi:hypothetical protein [Pedobacter foliorum]|uniref:hypothetical protein n=1 Tax=Pedobacter foliorum TaxID=2739058 RepID=UPI00156589B1|nr:hypothetical protein [Pedobacter foliorum]NRF42007.1 hypothetical protein [Pedobacter foliorum]
MNIVIKIWVRNPEWYSNDQKNPDNRIPKHSHSAAFKFSEEVTSYAKVDTDTYELIISTEDDSNENSAVLGTVVLKDVHVTEFNHGEDSTPVIISNEIIHDIVTTQKESGKICWDYFLKENIDILNLESNIWLSAAHRDQLLKEVPGLTLA